MTTKQFTPLVATTQSLKNFENMFRQSVDRYERAIKRAEAMIEKFDEGEIGDGMDYDDIRIATDGLNMLVNDYEERIDDLEKGIQEAQQALLQAS